MKLTGKVCQCRGCGRVFTTVSIFDRHRVGEYTNEPPKYGRRCWTDDELTAAGFRLDGRGRWAYPKMAAQTLAIRRQASLGSKDV